MAGELTERVRGAAFGGLVFLGSFLLFAIEFIAGKLLLPRFGSSAAVWTTSMVFFQAALLGGYLVAHRLTRPGRAHRWGQFFVLGGAALALPVRVIEFQGSPILAVGVTLAVAVGLPFVALSTTSIVSQRWLTASGLPGARDPYFLYATSNAGALAALLLYPTLIEPRLGIGAQLQGWYALYALFVLLHLVCVPRDVAAATTPPPAEAHSKLPWVDVAVWLLLSAAPNALLLAVTTAVGIDAPVPLLWMLPLTLFLLTLVLTFAPVPPSERAMGMFSGVALLLALFGLVLVKQQAHFQLGFVLFHNMIGTVGCLLAHQRLARARPADTAHLGSYWLAMSAGGALGSLMVGLGVPAAGNALATLYVEYVVAFGLGAAAFLLQGRKRLKEAFEDRGAQAWVLTAALGGVLLLAGVGLISGPANQVESARSFHGVYSVRTEPPLLAFRHGNTVHGLEALDPAEKNEPLTYYHRDSPVGRWFAEPSGPRRVGAVGLGVGSLAAYARPGDSWTFFELDGEVERLARAHFTFLSAAAVPMPVVVGDARLSLKAVPEGAYDVLVLDAFSSDFIPMHLVTREALALYVSRLAPEGVLLFHISSRTFDLVPVLTRLAADQGLHGAHLAAGEDPRPGHYLSHWLLMSRSPGPAKHVVEAGWAPLSVDAPGTPAEPWSDDHSNLFDALRMP